MEADNTEWKRMRFKKNKVWLAVDRSGKPLEQKGKVLIKYQLDQPHEYWVHKDSIKPLDSKPFEARPQAEINQATETDDPHAIQIYTDGASSGNPGPSGIGVVLRFGTHEKEISEYIGGIAGCEKQGAAGAGFYRQQLCLRRSGAWLESQSQQGIGRINKKNDARVQAH